MGEKMREHQICLRLNKAEFNMLNAIADRMHAKPTEILRALIREKVDDLWQQEDHIF